MLAQADPDLDNGPRTDRSATMRMCAVTREVRPIGELIRFVVSPQGEVIPDLKRKLPGRGLWVSASRQTVAEAGRRHVDDQYDWSGFGGWRGRRGNKGWWKKRHAKNFDSDRGLLRLLRRYRRKCFRRDASRSKCEVNLR